MTEWQPIETAPKDGTTILVYEGFEPCIAQVWWSEDEWRTSHGTERLWKTPSHWMPLPEPPSA